MRKAFKTVPANVWVLAASQAFAMSGVPLMVLVSGLLGTKIAPNEKLATLPMALMVVGAASSAIPVAWAMKRLGRKRGGFLGLGFSFIACLSGYLAAVSASFPWLLAAGFLMGVSSCFGQQLRFAALESVQDKTNYGPAISAYMTGGLAAAFLGPELGQRGQFLLQSPHGYAGSFLLMAGVVCLAAVVLCFFRDPARISVSQKSVSRRWWQIVGSKAFIIAAGTAAISYVMMSFVMTATPITMVELCGFSVGETKWVIQSHIFAMFAPSLASGWLMKRLGPSGLMFLGAVAYAAALVVGLPGQEYGHFWGSLALLGVGWNFLFASGTALLPLAYRDEERFLAQAANDFSVFGLQAMASLSAGWYLFSFGWRPLLWVCVPMVAIAFALAFLQMKRKASA